MEGSMTFNGNRYLCTLCPFSTNTTSSIRMHNQKCHSAFFAKKSPKIILRSKAPARVNASAKLSTSPKVLAHPKASTSPKKQLQCPDCSFKTDDKDLLSEHSSTHIEENNCSHCGTMFYSKTELVAHLNSAHSKEEGPVKCDLCSQEFPRVITMTYHRRTHMQSQSLKCPFCQKIFCDVIAFSNHQGLHTASNSKKK